MNFRKFCCLLSYQLLLLGVAVAAPEFRGYRVSVEEFIEVLEGLGTLRSKESADLSAPVTDVVSKIQFDDGQRVAAGDVLLEMTSFEESALLEEARSRVTEAKLQYERVKKLVKDRAASRALIDQRKRELGTSVAQLKAVKARLQDRLIVAPFAGVLGLRNISRGALLQQGDLVVTLDDDSEMKLDFQIPTTLLQQIPKSGILEASAPSFPGEVFKGKVKEIDSRVNTVSRALTVRAIIPNPDGKLKPGMLMTVRLKGKVRKLPAIPEETIVQRGSASFVFLLTPGDEEGQFSVSERQVRLGTRQPPLVAVEEGLQHDEIIVLRGVQYSRPGSTAQVPVVLDRASLESEE